MKSDYVFAATAIEKCRKDCPAFNRTWRKRDRTDDDRLIKIACQTLIDAENESMSMFESLAMRLELLMLSDNLRIYIKQDVIDFLERANFNLHDSYNPTLPHSHFRIGFPRQSDLVPFNVMYLPAGSWDDENECGFLMWATEAPSLNSETSICGGVIWPMHERNRMEEEYLKVRHMPDEPMNWMREGMLITKLFCYLDAYPSALIDGPPIEEGGFAKTSQGKTIRLHDDVRDDAKYHASPSAHWRNGHFRTLRNDKFKRGNNGGFRVIYVRGCIVNKESAKTVIKKDTACSPINREP